MKKNAFKKLRVSRETLMALTSAEVQTVAGAEDASRFSCPSGCGGAAICPATITVSLVTK